MIGVLGHDFCTDETILGWGATWVNEANFVMKHTLHRVARLNGGLKPSAIPIEPRSVL